MGQAQVTPKTLLLSHFSELRAKGHNYGMKIKKGKFDTLCSAEWPTFNVGWPPQGTFSLDTINKVRDVINRPSLLGHSDQYPPYVLMWQTLVEDPPSWLRPFIHESPTDRPMILAMSGNTPLPLIPLRRPGDAFYRQTFMAGVRAAACCPTNLAKVKAIMQGENESLAAFLEHLYDAYRQYTPPRPTSGGESVSCDNVLHKSGCP
jgi:hypothetical protein